MDAATLTLDTASSTARDAMHALLAEAIATEASDLHLLAGQSPRRRIHGVLTSWASPIDGAALEAMLRSVCPPAVADSVDRSVHAAAQRLGDALRYDLDFSHEATINGALHRFRFNVFYAHGRLGACIRMIPARVPSVDWAGLPPHVIERCLSFQNGLVLVTGVAGSGKSTTLAIVLERMVRAQGSRVITIEEPIEYIHAFGDNALITQREVGVDVPSFAAGLKYGLRQDPDVIMVGEIRDQETAQMALTAAETGHLVLSTMHTRDAKGAVSRFTDLFARDRAEEMCAQLALNLRAVLSQHLLPSALPGEKRILALEVMFNNLPVSSAIRSNNLVAIGDAVLTGKADGMITLDESLAEHVAAGRLDQHVALEYANNPARFQAALHRPTAASKRR
ncbi:MAG TPA: ATPase, T2SS/T4P/T4SS family [Phycisphaerae bacterium]|mgnify:CR=1 FL=1|nr:Flp pilus assembly complex ATPase component TadA [Phycisphaerales bacterium]HRX85022.1 ATPase, T2SS/T4P/T4SS family [Phycisphaerae bacterium]